MMYDDNHYGISFLLYYRSENEERQIEYEKKVIWLVNLHCIIAFNVLSSKRLLPSSSSSDENADFNSPSPLLYFNDDRELPVFSETTTGYSLQQIVGILMDQSLSDDKVCRIQPLGVNRNCTFIIDLDCVKLEDMKADDLGSWKSNGTRRSFFNLKDDRKACEFVKSLASGSFVIVRRYYVHCTYPKFRRSIIVIQGELNIYNNCDPV